MIFYEKGVGKISKESLDPINKQSTINNVEESKSKNILIVCVATVLCVLIVACAFICVNVSNDNVDNNDFDNKYVTAESSNMMILGGSFYTGQYLSDKTYAHIYVGTQYAGQQVKITTIWSRNGNNLNNGNILTRPVDYDGYVNFNSASAFKHYPDHAFVKLFDLNGNLIDTVDVNLSPTSGTQSF